VDDLYGASFDRHTEQQLVGSSFVVNDLVKLLTAPSHLEPRPGSESASPRHKQPLCTLLTNWDFLLK
jgi:hypothetical protein